MTHQTPPDTELPPPDPRLTGKVKVKKLRAGTGSHSEIAGRWNGSAPPQDDDAGRPNNSDSTAPALVSRCAAGIVPEKVEWLWPGRLARGKHTCIAGEPGTGKSQLTTAIVAAVTTGGMWPCGEGRAPVGNAIILSAEDGAADTIVPRLMASGADLKRVHVVSAVRKGTGQHRAVNLQNDLEILERKIAEVGDVALVVIDPVSSYLGKTDSHKNSEVRGAPPSRPEAMAINTGFVFSNTSRSVSPKRNRPTRNKLIRAGCSGLDCWVVGERRGRRH
jgi:hypothetical protein